MKQQFLFIVVISSAIFISCNKEKNETTNQQVEQPAINQNQKPANASASLAKKLECLYEFNSNLKETTGQLGDAIASTTGGEIYTDDRFGQPEKAIKFNGRYGLNIPNVPIEGSNFTLAAWVKYDSSNLNTSYFVHNIAACPQFSQTLSSYYGVVSTPITNGVASAPVNDKWHHLVATYDGIDLNLYVDGSFAGTVNNPFLGGPYSAGMVIDYQLGYMTAAYSKDIISTWFGSMDDFRFYTRTLSAKEVVALFNL